MPEPALRGLIADNIATSTHPSTPKPLASATSGENSSMAQRSTASGEAASNSFEITCQSLSVVSSLIDSAAKAIVFFPTSPQMSDTLQFVAVSDTLQFVAGVRHTLVCRWLTERPLPQDHDKL